MTTESCETSDNLLLQLKDLSTFRMRRILSDDVRTKTIVFEGRFDGRDEIAIVIFEKLPFAKETIEHDILNQMEASSPLRLVFVNSIYGSFECNLDPLVNKVKTNIIFPANNKHIQKYLAAEMFLIQETAVLYNAITLPVIMKAKFDLNWIQNILDGKDEQDRIIFHDPDPETGFVLLPDIKWNGKEVDNLYVLAIAKKNGIKSIRDLDDCSLPLLRNILRNGLNTICKRYSGISPSQIRAYFHYHPTFYHLHVHFTHLNYIASGSEAESIHLLSSVIRNIELKSDYYQSITLSFKIRKGRSLYDAYVKHGYNFCTELETFKFSRISSENVEKILDFFILVGKAKHVNCYEMSLTTAGESAWRLAIMSLCLPISKSMQFRLIEAALVSAAFSYLNTKMLNEEENLNNVRHILFDLLPADIACNYFASYCFHVQARSGTETTFVAEQYRKLIEMENDLIQYEERSAKGQCNPEELILRSQLIAKMSYVGFPGAMKFQLFQDSDQLEILLNFFLKITELMRLRRTGWLVLGMNRSETVASHMFRMGVMAILFNSCEKSSDAICLSIIHDMAECIVGDITPNDSIQGKEKHELEFNAMLELTKPLSEKLACEIFSLFVRYEERNADDKDAVLTKDLDRLDLILQAFDYEQSDGINAEEFFVSTKNKFVIKDIKLLVETLYRRRSHFFKIT